MNDVISAIPAMLALLGCFSFVLGIVASVVVAVGWVLVCVLGALV